MSKPNGRQKRAIQGLAAALQECFDASIELAERRFEERSTNERFDKQDETLRLIWRQVGGDRKRSLPIDD